MRQGKIDLDTEPFEYDGIQSNIVPKRQAVYHTKIGHCISDQWQLIVYILSDVRIQRTKLDQRKGNKMSWNQYIVPQRQAVYHTMTWTLYILTNGN